MIVCVCHNVSDRTIRSAADRGVNTMRALREELQVGTCCGKCHSCAKQVLKEHLDQQDATAPVFFAGALAA